MTMHKKTFRNTFLATLLSGLLFACLSAPVLAGVNARLDRNKVYEGDPVLLIIESDGRQAGEPDLSVLNKDFRVLGSSTSTRVSIINGRRSDTKSWNVQLEPRRLGTLRIPPVGVGGEQTRALELEVTAIPEQVAASQSGHVFLEVEADTGGHGVYVQQQIPYTVRLYYDDQVISGELEAPQPEQAVVEQLGEDKRYSVTRNGLPYNVIERRYAISAEKSGPLRIPPVSFKGEIASQKNAPGPGQNRLFERFFRDSPFANDPFFSNTPFATPGQPLRIRSKAIRVDVLPRPASAGNTWLPAEEVTLQDSWADAPPQLRAGEPVMRTITLQVKGLTGVQLPGLQLEQPGAVRLYPEAPLNESRTDGDKVYGISKQTFTYIPEKTGKLLIPSVELDWWNTRTNQAASARLPQWELNVEPGRGAPPAPPVAKPGDMIQASAADTAAPGAQLPPRPWLEQLKTFKHWPLAGSVLLIAMILVFAAKRIRQAGPGTPAPGEDIPAGRYSRGVIRDLVAQLEHACTVNDAKAAARTMLELGRARWPNDPPHNLGALAARLEEGGEQITTLDRALYAADTQKWNGADLYLAVKDAWLKQAAEKKTPADSLKPLYPESI